jgi:Ni/Co efflux regulator RcnB
MRKLFLSLLLASAAASPALADPNDHNDRQNAHAQHQAAHADRGDRGRGQPPAERPQFNGQARFNGPVNAPPQQFARPEHFQQNGGQDPRQVEAMREHHGFQNNGQYSEEGRVRYNPYAGGNAERFNGDRRGYAGSVPREGTQPPVRYDARRAPAVQWNRDWRRDERYDWRRWRDSHRDRFHIGVYYDPFGWGYQSFAIGWRLYPNYYAQNYWITDPWDFGLPYAPPGTQWVRYYNDVLLVDMYTGQVVDVIHGFFW